MIKAKDLARELMKNPNDIVCVTTSNFEQGHSTIPRGSVRVMRYKGNIVKESFRDAFDGGSYSSDVVRMDDNGALSFVQI